MRGKVNGVVLLRTNKPKTTLGGRDDILMLPRRRGNNLHQIDRWNGLRDAGELTHIWRHDDGNDFAAIAPIDSKIAIDGDHGVVRVQLAQTY